ncbi:MAG: methyltransferase domain-containing protein [Tepidisphaeraceae bacterium]
MARDRSQKYHNRVANKYDAIYDDVYWDFHDEVTWRRVKPYLPRDGNARCLDLGCGTGKWGLKLLKSGFPTTFVDHAPAMVGKVQEKLADMGNKQSKASTLVADIIHMPDLPDDAFALTLAMGDPLSICTDPARAAREMFRCCAPGGVVIATADAKLAAIEFFFRQNKLDELEAFMRSGRTKWLTDNEAEQFELTMFTPGALRKLFARAGFEVISVIGKTILPIRENRDRLGDPETFRRLVRIEEELEADEDAAARASHLQITAKKSIGHRGTEDTEKAG